MSDEMIKLSASLVAGVEDLKVGDTFIEDNTLYTIAYRGKDTYAFKLTDGASLARCRYREL